MRTLLTILVIALYAHANCGEFRDVYSWHLQYGTQETKEQTLNDLITCEMKLEGKQPVYVVQTQPLEPSELRDLRLENELLKREVRRLNERLLREYRNRLKSTRRCRDFR